MPFLPTIGLLLTPIHPYLLAAEGEVNITKLDTLNHQKNSW
jgi:hypothetical protein